MITTRIVFKSIGEQVCCHYIFFGFLNFVLLIHLILLIQDLTPFCVKHCHTLCSMNVNLRQEFLPTLIVLQNFVPSYKIPLANNCQVLGSLIRKSFAGKSVRV